MSAAHSAKPRLPSARRIQSFRRKVWRFYRSDGRDLPFRDTTDPYCITVSELMLQQTQVSRVEPKYCEWIARWPDWESLAQADSRSLLSAWSGLGYNRRARYLRDIARVIVSDYGGAMPTDEKALLHLPGIGAYTSRAILIFSANRNLAAVDTNVRQALVSEFPRWAEVSLKDLLRLAEAVTPSGRSRRWHYALMDYGSLGLGSETKRRIIKPKQSPFIGSLRQIRGEIIRRLSSGDVVDVRLLSTEMKRSKDVVKQAAQALEKDGMVAVKGNRVELTQ